MIRNLLIATALTASLAAIPALAHDRSHDKTAYRVNLDYIFNQLELDQVQREEVEAVLLELHREHREAMGERRAMVRERREAGEQVERPDREAWAARRQELHEERRAELASRLNNLMAEDQVEEFLTYLEAHRVRGHHGGKSRGHRGHWRGKVE